MIVLVSKDRVLVTVKVLQATLSPGDSTATAVAVKSLPHSLTPSDTLAVQPTKIAVNTATLSQVPTDAR